MKLDSLRRIIPVFEKTVQFLFVLFVSICCFFSIIYHGDLNQQTYSEKLNYCLNNPRIVIWLLAMLAFILAIAGLTQWRKDKTAFVFVLMCGIVAVGGSIAFSLWNGYTPVSDQEQMWEGGIQLVYGDSVSFRREYYEIYHNQVGGALLAAFLIRLTGSRSFMSWRILNSVCVGLIVYGLSFLSQMMRRDNHCMIITALLSVMFVPMIIYSSLVYGTLIALSLTIWSFLFLLLFIRRDRFRYMVISAVLCACANLVYSGTMIATVAIVLILLAYAVQKGLQEKKQCLGIVLAAILVVALCYSSSYAAQKFFYTKTGIDASQGLPATAYIYMGITSDDESSVCGPGTYNSSSVNLYNDNNKNAKQTRAAAAEKIKEALVDYATGRRSMDFFIKKIRNQWADPWFSSMIMVINYYDIDRPLKESFRSFLSSSLIGKIQTYLTAYRTIVYMGVLLYGLRSFRRKDCGKIIWENLLMFTFFVGGFVFYTAWEAKARYCLPYFVLLLPIAAAELARSSGIVKKWMERRILKSFLGKNQLNKRTYEEFANGRS